MKYYRQCLLKNCQVFKVVWIPEQLSKVGKTLKIKNDNNWTDGWSVVKVWDERLEESWLLSHERDYLTQRQASDI